MTNTFEDLSDELRTGDDPQVVIRRLTEVRAEYSLMRRLAIVAARADCVEFLQWLHTQGFLDTQNAGYLFSTTIQTHTSRVLDFFLNTLGVLSVKCHRYTDTVFITACRFGTLSMVKRLYHAGFHIARKRVGNCTLVTEDLIQSGHAFCVACLAPTLCVAKWLLRVGTDSCAWEDWALVYAPVVRHAWLVSLGLRNRGGMLGNE